MFWRDLLLAVRTLRKSPTFTLAATLMIAVGIGASTLMFSVMHSVLLRPLPYRDPDRLAVAYADRQTGANYAMPFLAMTAVFLAIAGVSSWLPARRAAGLDPTIALRGE